jgi:hypothetical protein
MLTFFNLTKDFSWPDPINPKRKLAAGSRHAWWLKFGRIDRLEEAILGMSVEIG